MTHQHTPGPWIYDDVVGALSSIKCIFAEFDRVGEVKIADVFDSEANALLIVQAPVMYETLEGIEGIVHQKNPPEVRLTRIISLVKAVLAKVEGGE